MSTQAYWPMCTYTHVDINQPAWLFVFSLSPQRSPLPPAQHNSMRIELYAVTDSFTELGPLFSMEGTLLALWVDRQESGVGNAPPVAMAQSILWPELFLFLDLIHHRNRSLSSGTFWFVMHSSVVSHWSRLEGWGLYGTWRKEEITRESLQGSVSCGHPVRQIWWFLVLSAAALL